MSDWPAVYLLGSILFLIMLVDVASELTFWVQRQLRRRRVRAMFGRRQP